MLTRRLLILIVLFTVLPGCASPKYSNQSITENKPDRESQETGWDHQNSEPSVDSSSDPGKTVDVRVIIDTGDQPLGAYNLIVQFNPNQAEVLNVTGGPDGSFQSPFHKMINDSQNTTSRLRIASFEIERAPTGKIPVAVITFSTSDPESKIIKDVVLETVSDADGNQIDASVSTERVR